MTPSEYKELKNLKRENLRDHMNDLELIYFEGCLNQDDAIHREKYLKTSWGKKYIKNRIKHYLTGLGERATTEITQTNDSQGFGKLKQDAKEGGKIAGDAKNALEQKTEKKVSTNENYLDAPESKKRLK
ncbi:MAG: hypothetical protein JEY97_11235 [Bacteroidales bacterium]|nr:hypothetical protein [Bacteroidales bacterium]